MQIPALSAERRTNSGTKAMRKLRAVGGLPGVLYGQGAENINLQFKYAAVDKLVREANHVVELDFGGQKAHALFRGLQRNYLGDELQHVDFLRISLDDKIKLHLPLHFLGTPKGAAHGGLLETMRTDVAVLCPARNVPRYLEVEVTHLDVGEAVRYKDIKLPEGAELNAHPESVVVKCAHARRAEELEAPVAPGAAAAVPGAPAAAGTPAEGATPAADGAPAAAGGKGAPAKKEGGKK